MQNLSLMTTIDSTKRIFVDSRLRLLGLAFLLAVIFPAAASAQLTNTSYTTQSDGNGGVIITGFSASGSGPLVIPSALTNLPVTGIGANVFSYENNITSVTIPNTVLSIGAAAFEGCSNLTSVSIPPSVTSIGQTAFYACTSLTSVSIPGSVTSIGEYAFGSCSSLTNAYFWGNAPAMGGYVFYSVAAGFTVDYYLKATGFTSPTWNPDVDDFYPATLLSVTSPGQFTTASDNNGGLIITTYNGSDAQVSMPDTINGLTVTGIGSAFTYDLTLTSVTLPAHLTSIGANAFKNCSFLKTVAAMPNSVTSIGANAFANCFSLTSLSFGTGLTSIGQGAFNNCSALTSAFFPGNAPSMGGFVFSSAASSFAVSYYNGSTGFNSPTWAPDQNDSYPAINLGNDPAQFTTTSDGNGGLVVTQYNGSNSTVIIPGTINGLTVTAIGLNAVGTGPFQGNGLISVTIPNGVTSIGYQAFAQCATLTSVTLPSSLTSIGISAFSGCTSLASVTIPSKVNSIGSEAFAGCSSLTGVIIPNAVTSIGVSTFSGCTSLASVTIPSSVTSIGIYAFFNCTSLTSAAFQGASPAMGGYVFAGAGSGFTVTYFNGAAGFTSPTWTPDANDSYPAGSVADAFAGTVTGTANIKYSSWFGYYNYASYPLVYEFNLGYEYAFTGGGGVYLYDYTSGHFWYTQGSYFPFVYDFSLGTYLYYYQSSGSKRYFYDYGTNKVISE